MIQEWFTERYDILYDAYLELYNLLILKKRSDPAEVLEEVKQRLDQTKKELDNVSKSKKLL